MALNPISKSHWSPDPVSSAVAPLESAQCKLSATADSSIARLKLQSCVSISLKTSPKYSSYVSSMMSSPLNSPSGSSTSRDQRMSTNANERNVLDGFLRAFACAAWEELARPASTPDEHSVMGEPNDDFTIF